jgi:hypothetical protein
MPAEGFSPGSENRQPWQARRNDEYQIMNFEPQKHEPGFEIHHSLFDIPRFK